MLSKIKHTDGYILLAAILGFSFTIGSETNNILHFQLSKLFSVVLLISVVVTYVDNRSIFRNIPKLLLVYFAYTTIQLILNYLDSTPDYSDYHILKLTKFLLFITIIPVIPYLMNSPRLYIAFTIAYSTGVILMGTVNLSMYFFMENPNPADLSLRVSGGYLDPNSFGTSAAMACILIFYMIVNFSLGRGQIFKSFILLIFNLFFLDLSQSRAVFLSMIIFMLLLYIYVKPHALANKIRTNIMWILPAFIITFFIPAIINNDNMSRLNVAKRIIQNKEPRLLIWSNYIAHGEIFIFRGAEYHNQQIKNEATKSLKTSYDTHNKYLNIYFESGLICLLLFILCIFLLLMVSWKNRKNDINSVILLFAAIAWCVMIFFEDYQGSRDYFLFIGFFVGVYFRITGRHTNKNLDY